MNTRAAELFSATPRGATAGRPSGVAGAVPAVPSNRTDDEPNGHAQCNTMSMKKQLPEAVKGRTPSEKLVWLYIDRYPGEHSVRTLKEALGATADRALPALVRDGLLIEEVAPAGSRLGKYRTAEIK